MFSVPFFLPRILSVLLLAAAITGCRKFIQVPPPDTTLSAAVIFGSDPTAIAAMMGVYSQAMNTPGTLLNGGMSAYAGLSSDELAGNGLSAALNSFATNTLVSTNFYVSTLYASGYNCIYNANAVLGNLSQSPAISDTVRSQLNGEARFLRAFTYFNLVNLFGGVPLETQTNYAVNAVTPRATSAAVYNQIALDLTDAQLLLSPSYATGITDPNDRTRPNQWAAAALLARVYLYEQDWADAETTASAVINSGQYQLVSLDSVFLATSREAIWQLQPVGTAFNTVEGYLFVPAAAPSSVPLYTLTNFQVLSFEAGDLRRQHWTGTKTIQGTPYIYPFKYKVKAGGPPYKEYEMVLRLAEQYLIRAEARARLNDLADAIADLNIIHVRAGLAGFSLSLSQADVLAAIMQERRAELFTEWGHRWLDLKRTGQADAVLQEKPGWRSQDTLYPIPLTELQHNPNLVQNTGY